MFHPVCRIRGSALLLSLGVLALLAIMGTTFVTMTRMESKLNTRYVDDVQCEMLVKGLLEYCRGILADDLDRSMKVVSDNYRYPQIAHRYENRDAAAPYIYYSGYANRLTGLNTDDNVRNLDMSIADNFVRGKTRMGVRLGIGPSNDFWMSGRHVTRELTGSFRSVLFSGWDRPGQVGSFYNPVSEVVRMASAMTWGWTERIYILDSDGNKIWNPETNDYLYTERHTTVTVDPNGVGYDVWVTLLQNGLDDDSDGIKDPYVGQAGESSERNAWYTFYDTCKSFLTPGDACGYLQGPQFTGDPGFPGGRTWRTALRIGMPTSMYCDINVIGNKELADTAYMDNMDGQGLHAGAPTRAGDVSTYGENHLGLISFAGYTTDTKLPGSGSTTFKPYLYDPIGYSPLQIDLREPLYSGLVGAQNTVTTTIANTLGAKAEDWRKAILSARYNGADRAGNGNTLMEARLRPGWQADGASHRLLPSPDAPVGNVRYFGAE